MLLLRSETVALGTRAYAMQYAVIITEIQLYIDFITGTTFSIHSEYM